MAQPLKIMMIIAIALIQCVMRTANEWITVLLPVVAAVAGFAIKAPSPSVAPFNNPGPSYTLPNSEAHREAARLDNSKGSGQLFSAER